MRSVAALLGALGGIGGILTAVWEQRGGLSDSGDPVGWIFSKTEVRAVLIVVAALFGMSLVAALLSLKTPKTSGLILIFCGGVGLVLSFVGAGFGGLFLMPSGFLVLLGGAMMAASGANVNSRA